MIKKDIDLNVEVESTETVVAGDLDMDEVDKIFANADRTMDAENKAFGKPKKKKKKKNKGLRVFLLSVLIIFLFIAGSVGMFLYSCYQSFPTLKSNLIVGFKDAQIQLLDVDDSTLSPIDVCGKKMILLISTEKIDENIQDIFDLFEFTNKMNKGINIDDSFVNDADKDEFNRLKAEYEKLKKEGYELEEGHIIIPEATIPQ